MRPKSELTQAQALYYRDLNRLRGKRGQLFELLADQKWHSNADCARVGGLSFNDSLFAFRQQGWVIESRLLKGGTWQFRLRHKGEPPKHRAMTRPQRLVAGHYTWAIDQTLDDDTAREVKALLPDWMRTLPSEWKELDPSG